MHGRLACGRPLVVRLASEKYFAETLERPPKAAGPASRGSISSSSSSLGQGSSRSAKIAAIKSKLKVLEEESSNSKKQRPS
ncbi:uncharacterized protein LOC116193986 isoform X3 [Punica granatum]|uniref:Uncharacterized protein LOC116193986 isoform X3 n=3 Tax=Punica granatum TaxID=22663 RepID=A0A6P8C4Z5_PUNGR|nr:uncharacterized protein LOC116193986 isoform X3 [Punica granatum]